MGQTPKTFAQATLSRAISTIWTAPSSNIIADLITDILISNNTRLDNPLAPTITQGGTPGTTSYTYYVVANDAWGNKTSVSAAGTTTTGNATLSASNYNIITWTPVPGAVSYDILKGNMTTSLATATTGTVSGNNLTFNDTGQGTAAYTTPTANNTGIKSFVTIHHVPSGGTPSIANQNVRFYEVDQGVPVDLSLNIPLAPGDMIQALVNSGNNADGAIDGKVTMAVRGVEFS